MTDTTPTADQLIDLWHQITDEVTAGIPLVALDLITAYTNLFARYQLERAAADLHYYKYYSAATAVRARFALLADLALEI